MISETRFAKRYGSVWRSLAPTMELFIRKCNMSLYTRNWPELNSASAPGARALINRTAFELFCAAHDSGADVVKAQEFIAKPEHISAAELAVEGVESLNDADRAEATELARRMWFHFNFPQRVELGLRPPFRGCGIINACEGDVLCPAAHLVELKDGDRAFRSYEFRQLSVYAALFLNDTGDAPSSLEVVNSRRGVSIKVSMDTFADEVAGQSAIDYLRELIRVISDESISG